MDPFHLFAKLKSIEKDDTFTSCSVSSTCKHTNITVEHGITLCVECGIEIMKPSGNSVQEMKNNSDPTRYYVRKEKDKTIYQDVQSMYISDHIKDIANNIYMQVCGDKVHRGSYRKAIVFASVFHAYKIDNNPQSCENLIKIFEIKRKDALKGLKFVNENIPSDAPLRTTYITPEHLIHEFMNQLNASSDQIKHVVSIYRRLRGKSSMLNRSRPQSVAAGIIYYYMVTTNRKIAIKDFIQKVSLSELTVNKISKEISRILE